MRQLAFRIMSDKVSLSAASETLFVYKKSVNVKLTDFIFCLIEYALKRVPRTIKEQFFLRDCKDARDNPSWKQLFQAFRI